MFHLAPSHASPRVPYVAYSAWQNPSPISVVEESVLGAEGRNDPKLANILYIHPVPL